MPSIPKPERFTEENTIPYIMSYFPELEKLYEDHMYLHRESPPEIDENDPLGWTKQIEIDEFVPEPPSLCAQLMGFFSLVCDLVEKEDIPRLKRIFSLIEEVLESNPDQEFQGDFGICFFESLLNRRDSLNCGEDINPLYAEILNFLGPISKGLCAENDAFWEDFFKKQAEQHRND